MVEYVMVPVPEEFADEVARYLQWTVNASARPELDRTATARSLATLDEPGRTLLASVADGVLNGEGLAIVQLALALRCSEREVAGTMLAVNQAMWLGGTPVVLMPQKPAGARHVDFNDQIVTMSKDAAQAVGHAARLGNADDA